MELRQIVCLKSVPASDSAALLDSHSKTLKREACESKINTLDRHALAAAVSLKAQYGGTIRVLCMGPPNARLNLTEALALGADAAYLLSDPAFAGSDTLATSYILAQAIAKLGAYDLILCGAASDDGGTAQVPAQLAEWLQLPHLHQVVELGPLTAAEQASLTLTTAEQNRYRRWQARLPLLLSVDKRLSKPQPARMREIRLARQKPLALWQAADLPGLDPARIGLAGSPTQFGETYPLVGSRSCEMRRLSAEESARLILQQLRSYGATL